MAPGEPEMATSLATFRFGSPLESDGRTTIAHKSEAMMKSDSKESSCRRCGGEGVDASGLLAVGCGPGREASRQRQQALTWPKRSSDVAAAQQEP